MNIPVTCYRPADIDYAPHSADLLLRQSEILLELANTGNFDPETLRLVLAALEHDMAFYALTDCNVDALYARLQWEWEPGSGPPGFEELPLEPSPDAKAAARFLIELLTGD